MSKRAEKRAATEIRHARRMDRLADKKSLQHMAARITELETALESVLSPAFIGIVDEAEEHPRMTDDDFVTVQSKHLQVHLTVGDLRKGIQAMRGVG